MKTESQHTAELAYVCSLIQNLSIAMLTAENDEGGLVTRPMSPLEMDGDGGLWFFTDRRAEMVEHLENLKLSFHDEANTTFISLTGRGELSLDSARIEKLWTPSVRPQFPEGRLSRNLALLKFVPQSAEYGRAPNNRTLRFFTSPKSAVSANLQTTDDTQFTRQVSRVFVRRPGMH